MKKSSKIILSILLISGLMLAVFTFMKLNENEQVENAGLAINAPQKIENLEYNGKSYPLKKHLQTVLLIGTDDDGNKMEIPEGFTVFYNFNQADFLVLLVIDRDEKQVNVIQVNRDTMTDVPWLDVIGQHGGTVFEQICLCFNSGSGGMDSCKITQEAVSSLLFDAPIQSFLQIPMTAIPTINDLVGGVPVTIEDDLTPADPTLIQGKTIRLNGKQAEHFVRARMVLADDTNIARMRRHRTYIESFRNCARDAMASDPQFPLHVLETMDGALQTNMTAQQLSDMMTSLNEYTIKPIQTADGELVVGEEFYEFYVNEDSLWKIVCEAYCR